jgi:hypothetical protein
VLFSAGRLLSHSLFLLTMLNTNTDRDLAAIRQDLSEIKQLLTALIEQQKPTAAKTTRRTSK